MRAQKGKTIRARPTIERGLLEFADGFQIPVTQLKKNYSKCRAFASNFDTLGKCVYSQVEKKL